MDKFKLRRILNNKSRGQFFKFYEKFFKNFCDRIGEDNVCYNLDTEIGKIMFLKGGFEEKELAIVKKIIKSDDVILDIGANIGLTSLFFSRVASNGLIFSFEPAKDTFSILLKNVTKFKNVIPLNIGLSNTDSLETFYENSDNAYSGFKNTKRKEIVGESRAISLKLDSFFGLLNLKKIDFIKIDVEGLEFNVLQGGAGIIDKYRPIIFCEIYQGLNSNLTPNETINFLINKNYRPQVFMGEKFVDYKKHDDKFYNYLFIPKEHSSLSYDL